MCFAALLPVVCRSCAVTWWEVVGELLVAAFVFARYHGPELITSALRQLLRWESATLGLLTDGLLNGAPASWVELNSL